MQAEKTDLCCAEIYHECLYCGYRQSNALAERVRLRPDEFSRELDLILSWGHRQIELADLTSQYGQLTKKRAHALDAYSRAFATPKERPTLQELIAVLGQMVTNREQAVALGDKAAEKQLILCRTEAEKYKRK